MEIPKELPVKLGTLQACHYYSDKNKCFSLCIWNVYSELFML